MSKPEAKAPPSEGAATSTKAPETATTDGTNDKSNSLADAEGRLLRAVGAGDLKETQAAAKGLRLADARTGNGATALHLACFGKNTLLLLPPPPSRPPPPPRRRATGRPSDSAGGHVEIAEWLHVKGLALEARDGSGGTPFHARRRRLRVSERNGPR